MKEKYLMFSKQATVLGTFFPVNNPVKVYIIIIIIIISIYRWESWGPGRLNNLITTLK